MLDPRDLLRAETRIEVELELRKAAYERIRELEEQLEAAERVVRLATTPIIDCETYALEVHAEARDYFKASNPASRPSDA